MIALACYIMIWSYVRGRCCIYNRRSRGIFYLLYRIGECGVRRHWRLFCNNNSPAPIYRGYLPRTGVYFGACCAPGAVRACRTWHLCWLYIFVGYLAQTWCKRGWFLQNSKLFPSPMELRDIYIYILWDMYALTRGKVKYI